MRVDHAATHHRGALSVLLFAALQQGCGSELPYGLGPDVPRDDDSYATSPVAPDCRPNNDGTITKDEMPFILGAVERVRVQDGPVHVDVDGFLVDGTGVRKWDFSTPAPETLPQGRLELQKMEGQWFAGTFPNAQYAGPLVPGGALLGPLRIDDDGVKLFGTASAEENPPAGKTLIAYDVPVVLYRFPMTLGTSVTTRARATNAIALGLPVAVDDTYTVEVTGKGTLVLPDLILENTLRVTIRLARTALAGDARQVTHVWVHECLGEVARVVSPTVSLAESMPDSFTTAQQVWRLAL